jgi:PAS domain S-box-containing protein
MSFLAPELADWAPWKALVDAPMASLACAEDGQLVFVNAAMLVLLDLPLERLLGRGWMGALFAGGDASEGAIAEVLAAHGTTRHRREVNAGGARRRVLDLTSTAIRLPDGRRGVMTIAADTASLRTLALPSPSPTGGGRGYRELVEDAPDVFARFEPRSGRLVYVSRAIERFTGLSPEALCADPALWLAILDEESRAAWQAALGQVSRGDARTFEVGLRHKDGRRIILQQALYPVRDGAGAVCFIEGTARDVTSVRQLEALKAKNEERASLDRLKSQLLANVSHELRTPLVSIKGYNELLLRGALGPLTPRQKRSLEIAGANTERLIDLIETLLELARYDQGRLELHPERVDVRDLVSDAARALADRIGSRNLDLTVDVGSMPLFVMADRERLTQVFRVLIGNAEKFSDGANGSIEVTARAAGEHVEVSVADRGIGIPAEAQARIFDRFYQVDASPTRRFGGAGLGLALAKELVTLHDGEITVESVEGGGSTFTVKLPLAEAPRRPAERPGGRMVLLVGADEPAWHRLRPLLEGTLGALDLFWAPNEAEAVRRARRHRPDVVLLAFARPAPVVDELKRDRETSHLPVVVVTADGQRPIGRADLVAEADDPERLVAALQRLAGPRAPAPARRPRVVVVEDEVEILDFTRFVLEREGYDVACLTTGEEALATVDDRCDLVILDIALEGSDGIEICRQLKAGAATREVPILMMTAMSGEEVQKGSLAAGAEGYLMKPFGVDEFLRQVRLHLRAAPQPGLEP